MRLEGRLKTIDEITPAQRDQMFALMDAHYLGTRRDVFEADLNEKHWVITLAASGTDEILGFSTQMIFQTQVDGREINALFSGDTIIDPRYWGSNNHIQIWGRLALSLMDAARAAFPPKDLYWFLISKGYKTYRYLPVFFHEFHPRFDAETPAETRAILDALARHKYANQYDPEAGVIRASPGDACRLREGIAQITPERMSDPHVRFFLQRNPEHARGDELCCLAPLMRANFTRAAYRAIGPETALPAVASFF